MAIKMPDLKQFNPLGRSVDSTDVLIGAAAGQFLNGLVKKQIVDRFLSTNVFVQNNYAFIGPVLTAALVSVAAGYVPAVKKRATGLYIGVLAGGLLPAVATKISSMAGFADTVAVNLQGLNGLLIEENPSVNGLGYMITENQPALNGMGDLAALSMSEDEDYDGLAELVNVQF